MHLSTIKKLFQVIVIQMAVGVAVANAQVETSSLPDGEAVADSIEHDHEHPQCDTIAASPMDSTVKPKSLIYSWRYDESSFVERRIAVDTLPARFQVYHPAQNADVFALTAGGIGRPSYSTSFYHNRSEFTFLPANAYASYFFSQQTAPYFNTKKPFSKLKYAQASNDEQLLNALVTVNVTRFWNVGLQLGFLQEKGERTYESVGDKQMRLFSSHRTGRYFSIVNVCFNRYSAYETGGLYKDSLLGKNTERYSLSNASSKTSYSMLYSRQELNLLKPVKLLDSSLNRFDDYRLSVGILQQVDYTDRTYRDANLGDTTFYRKFGVSYPTYLAKKATARALLPISDSLQQILLRNEGFFRFTLPVGDKNRLTLVPTVGLEYERNHYSSNYQQRFPVEFQSFYMKGFGAIKIHQLELNATLSQWISGRKSGDFKGLVNLIYQQPLKNDTIELRASALFESSVQPYYVENLNLSHLQWSNNFDKTQKTELRGYLGLADGRMGVGAVSSVLNNYVYFNETAVPQQEKDVIATMAVYAQKKTRLWRFVLENEVVFQKTSKASVLPLPTYTMYHAFYYSDKFFQKKLTTMLGVDVNYYEKYYAPGYMPLTGVFYNQTEVKTGNFPLLNVFCNMQFKRITVLFKLNNVMYFTGDNNYFTVPHYAAKKPGFIFALNWHFHY